jgi:hypothetical protein
MYELVHPVVEEASGPGYSANPFMRAAAEATRSDQRR